MISTRFIPILLSSFLLTCVTEVNTAAMILEDDPKMCQGSCEHLKELGCTEGQDFKHNGLCSMDAECFYGICQEDRCTESCQMICEDSIKTGAYHNLSCWASIKSCSQLDDCY